MSKLTSQRSQMYKAILIAVAIVALMLTPLCLATVFEDAVADGDTFKINLLLRLGIPPSLSDSEQGYSPLMGAASRGHADVVRELLAYGADVNGKTALGWTPLICSITSGKVATVKLLLQSGARVNDRIRDSGETALTTAIESGFVEGVALLIANNADINQKLADGSTPLEDARAWLKTETNPERAAQRKKIVELLRRAGAQE